ncbi:Luciferin 4-monooxygenase [Eumeta japonica]|uniref:Luciferin 4-monooxygenase n=1 Tax=Eumeta variegata TaxID=151549 RepID=A0A4C1SHB4_EUMVA|nr:Luciferin 4-monooxygenase [Eumeta japonica]
MKAEEAQFVDNSNFLGNSNINLGRSSKNVLPSNIRFDNFGHVIEEHENEIKATLSFSKPKIIFCQNDSVKIYEEALKSLGLDATIITFHEGECTMEDFINKHSTEDDVNNFKAADFDPDEVFSWLVSTSGSTGVPKMAAFTGRVVFDAIMFYAKSLLNQNKGTCLLLSPVQWSSNYLVTLSAPLTRTTILKTSTKATTEHIVDMINKYKPNFTILSPLVITQILQHPDCDLSCFDVINLGGSKVYKDLITDLRTRTKGKIVEAYGQTECMGVLYPVPGTPLGSCGKALPQYELKLVDPETNKEIREPNVSGELHVKGPMFSGYYKNPEETAKAFSEDNWLKTGDIMYRDENDFFYFVERIKMLIKCKNYHLASPPAPAPPFEVHPTEIEEIVRELPDVVEVAVTGVPDPEHGEAPAACVIRRAGSELTAQEIKDLIKGIPIFYSNAIRHMKLQNMLQENTLRRRWIHSKPRSRETSYEPVSSDQIHNPKYRLSDAKQLRGGVVFVDSLPLTSTGKVARMKLGQVVRSGCRE